MDRTIHSKHYGERLRLPPASLEDRGHLRSLLDCEKIRPYFNSGFVIAPARSGLMRSWLQSYTALLSSEGFRNLIMELSTGSKVYEKATTFLDQVALALALSTVDRVDILPPIYNCPIHYVERFPEPWRSRTSNEVRHVHYLDYLHSA